MKAGDYQLSLETECQCWNVMTWTLQYGSSSVNSLRSVQEFFNDASIWVSDQLVQCFGQRLTALNQCLCVHCQQEELDSGPVNEVDDESQLDI